ncbi:hypothetical protein [Streptomyces sp. NPDC056707]|uniref:hypothetical protein n=1 Tax=Streptomyces sp. NPDC056707 TaxID=3345919 RepID=UPI0036A4879E
MNRCEAGARRLLGAVFGPTSTGDPGYARKLLPLLGGSMLFLADRNFSGDESLNDVAGTRAHLPARLTYRRRPAVISVLPDGAYLTRLRGRAFRIIEASATASCADGSGIADRYTLATTLLNHQAERPAAPYHERWEVELTFLALKDTLFAGQVLRSGDPMGLQEELWALLIVYQSLRRAMVDAIESRSDTDPDRASFTIALRMEAEQVITARGVLEPADGHGGNATAVLDALLPLAGHAPEPGS